MTNWQYTDATNTIVFRINEDGSCESRLVQEGDNPLPFVAPALTWAEYQVKAQILLDKSDLVAMRCFKNGVIFPTDWITYVMALRAIIASPIGDPTLLLPITPPYPQGS